MKIWKQILVHFGEQMMCGFCQNQMVKIFFIQFILIELFKIIKKFFKLMLRLMDLEKKWKTKSEKKRSSKPQEFFGFCKIIFFFTFHLRIFVSDGLIKVIVNPRQFLQFYIILILILQNGILVRKLGRFFFFNLKKIPKILKKIG